jgi:hypothetical protein
MKHVLGMVKRNLDLKGAKAPKLELDFLRLAYVVKELRQSGKEAKGYLLVMTPEIAQRVEGWRIKYKANDSVLTESALLTPTQRASIEQEVERNTEGMIAGTLGNDTAGRSDASAGGGLGEVLLEEFIERHEAGVSRKSSDFPFSIRWDYYGVR